MDVVSNKLRSRVLEVALELILATSPADILEFGADSHASALSPNLDFLKELPIRTWAEFTVSMRRHREVLFGADLFGDPAWDILLEVLIAEIDARPLNVSNACVVGNMPMSTGLRWVVKLEEDGFIKRVPDQHDRRVSWVRMTAQGIRYMAEHFNHEIGALAKLGAGIKRGRKGRNMLGQGSK